MLWRRWLVLLALTLAAILVPFFFFGDRIEALTSQLLASNAGWWTTAAALAGLLALDIVLPVPSSLVSTAAGALLGFWGGIAVSWTGMSAGCALGYWLGVRVPMSEDMDRVKRMRERFGDAVLVLFRPVPVLAEASVLFAGFTRMPPLRFFFITALANLGISLAYVATAVLSTNRQSFLLAFAGATLIPAIGMLATRAIRRGRS
jgi:uncharacterized membrane protein YdjX (TVP38/TMEM64 family)